jgi:predicted rRNA methylase YqxC with S4 and FtsJ domains
MFFIFDNIYLKNNNSEILEFFHFNDKKIKESLIIILFEVYFIATKYILYRLVNFNKLILYIIKSNKFLIVFMIQN